MQLDDIQQQRFARALSKLRTPEELTEFCRDFFSPAELASFYRRWEALELLGQKENYLDIQRKTGLSSATIAKMSSALKYGSGVITRILQRI